MLLKPLRDKVINSQSFGSALNLNILFHMFLLIGCTSLTKFGSPFNGKAPVAIRIK